MRKSVGNSCTTCAILVAIIVPIISGCAGRIPRGALAMNPQTIEFRERSTRRFHTTDESRILAASAALLQDLGFVLDNSETELGLIVASKARSAVEGGQVAAKIAYAILFQANLPIDAEQKLRASIVTRPEGSKVSIRVTFQRVVWNDRGQVSKREALDEPAMYQEFFDKLSKSVFLEAHEI